MLIICAQRCSEWFGVALANVCKVAKSQGFQNQPDCHTTVTQCVCFSVVSDSRRSSARGITTDDVSQSNVFP